MIDRKQKILNDLKDVMSDMGGLERDKITDQATFLELGFDSLFLAQMSTAFKKKFGVNITFRQLLEGTTSPEALADYINAQMAPGEPTISERQPSIPTKPIPLAPAIPHSLQSFAGIPPLRQNPPVGKLENSANLFERVLSQQLQVMARQLEVLKYGYSTPETQVIHTPFGLNGANHSGADSGANGQKPENAVSPIEIRSVADETESRPIGPWKPIDKSDSRSLDARQRIHLDDLIERYTRRTAKSKELTAAHRSHLADPRAVSGFRTEWKEMIYPIVSVRSSGSKLWDVDGNEYVDMMMGFGPALFGHSPDFVVRALEDQLKSGIEIGPQSPIVGEVARLVCDFTGMERVTFCNTGSEAVLAALRVARTVTGRNKIALFAGSYHGIFDEVLVRPITNREGSKPVPAAPGIPAHMVQDVLVLRYDDPDSLNLVEKHADELAAVLVEPVQSRNPDLQPKEFLQSLRELTAKSGIALIFDEVITGFRLDAGGAQAWFGVQADLATYGKALGGGMPIGALAGKARFMDALDGGAWNYGDNSIPEVGVTYFAGTFVRHPLAMAAASAVLQHMKLAGSELYQRLNERAYRLAKELNQHFEGAGIPIHIQQCGSLFCITFTQESRYSSLLFYHLRDKGIHIWEGRPTFISTAHSDEDLAFIVRAMKESVEEMQRARFLPSADLCRTVTEPRPADSGNPTASASPASFSGVYEFPLTEAQMEIWLATRLGDAASQAFNENILLQFKGTLDLDAMRFAVQRAINRHDALRTTFSHDGSYQRVGPAWEIDIPLIDLSQLDDGNKKVRFESLITRELQQPFDLVNGPLVRVSILRLEPERHFLLITAHHLVCDGWSIHVLLGDLSALYRPAGTDKGVDLPQSTPLREYAAWQQKQQNSADGLATERYWLDRFANPVAALKLPADRPRAPFRTFNGSSERITIEAALHTGMKQLGARHGCTAFTTFLAAFKVLLHRLTAQEDLVVGIAVAGQSIIGIDMLVGHCVNTLPLRNRIEPNQPFTEFLKSANRSFLDAYEHQNYTFGTLVRKLNLSRDPSQPPLISLMFNMDQELQGLGFGDLDFELCPDPNPHVNFELSFNLVEKQGELILECEYNTDLFDATTIRRWIGHYENLLREILVDPNQPISRPSLLSGAARHQLLIEWNRTESPYPKDKCIHQLFEAQAEQIPDAVAVVFEDQRLTYQELNRRANQLAHHLQNLGVGPEVLVGICVEHSLEMMIGILGIWKAGGAYLPLDPAYPKERLAAIMEDSRVSVLLTQRRLLDRPPGHKTQIVYLDNARDQFVQESASNPVSKVTAQNLAYVIYTSGSTGTPKGVMIEHENLVNYIWWLKESPLTKKTESLPLITRLTFDASLKQLFVPLLQSRQVWILSDDVINRPFDLLKTLSTRASVGLNCVPALWSTLLDGIDSNRAITSTGFLSSVFLGGERLDNALIARTLDALPDVELWNLYGPTEATANAIVGKISRDQPISLGRPIANTQIYILDTHLQPVPVGIPGELYIGGAGLARGYLNRPELTNEKFISNPFSPKRGERLFKTGDMARYMSNGNIEFLGRFDNQVKIRGFRIELGEIEAVLNQHPGLRESVVTSREDVPGDKRLVAYLVPKKEPAPAIRELRSFLKEKLPDYMVPSGYVLLDSLPLTLNGKVDRRALPDLGGTEQQESNVYVAPQDETERILCRVWSEVLRVHRVGLDDDFFALGGHSLLAAKLFVRLDKEFGRSLPLSVLLSAPTIRSLAEHYRRVTEQKPNLSLVAIRAAGTLPPIYAVPGMFGNVVGFAELAKELGGDQPFYGLQSIGLDGAKAPLDSIEEMAKLYISEIRSVQSRGPYSLIGACFGATVAYEMARQLLDQGEKVAFLGLLDPTDREGNVESKNDVYLPRALKRSLALSSLLTGRLRLYREEMWKLRGRDRTRYVGCKLGSLTGLMRTHRLMATKRELNQIDVYQANLRALDRYHRLPLRGCLKALHIFETMQPHNKNAQDWNGVWSGRTRRHLVPGKDSGDMLTGKNVRVVAALLAEQLALVLEKSVTAIEPELTFAPA